MSKIYGYFLMLVGVSYVVAHYGDLDLQAKMVGYVAIGLAFLLLRKGE